MDDNNRPKDFLFVLKDKGTNNQGWWLKISSADELCAYYEEIVPTRYGKVFENYLYGKEWNWAHPSFKNTEHSKYLGEAEITEAVVRWGSERNLNIIQSIKGFQMMVAEQQLDTIHECGAIYINPVGGYHGYSGDKEYAFVRRKDIMNRSKIKDFAVSTHFTTAMDFSFGIFPITIIPRFNRTVYRFVNSLFSCDFAIPHISSVTSCTLHRRVLLTFICQPQRKSQVKYSLGMASVGVFFYLKT